MSNDRLALGRQIYDYFVGKGLAPHQAAAIAGNMAWEGGGRTDLVNPGDNWKNSPHSPHSAGIAQWNDRLPALLDYARQNGLDLPQGDLRDQRYVQQIAKVVPLQTQLDFAWNEMQGPEKRAYGQITAGNDLRTAVAGAIGYHRPAGWTRSNPYGGHGFDNRYALADQIMRGGDVPASVATASSARMPAPYALGGPRATVEPVSRSALPPVGQTSNPAPAPSRAPEWNPQELWDKQLREGHAEGGKVDPVRDELAEYRQPELSAYDEPWYRALPNKVTDWWYGPDANARQAEGVRTLLGPQNPLNLPGQVSEGTDIVKEGIRTGDYGRAALGGLEALGAVAGPFAATTKAAARMAPSARSTAAEITQAEKMAAAGRDRPLVGDASNDAAFDRLRQGMAAGDEGSRQTLADTITSAGGAEDAARGFSGYLLRNHPLEWLAYKIGPNGRLPAAVAGSAVATDTLWNAGTMPWNWNEPGTVQHNMRNPPPRGDDMRYPGGFPRIEKTEDQMRAEHANAPPHRDGKGPINGMFTSLDPRQWFERQPYDAWADVKRRYGADAVESPVAVPSRYPRSAPPELRADGGIVEDELAEYRTDPSKHVLSDPLSSHRTIYRDGPAPVAPWDRSSGKVTGELRASPARPADWAVSSGIAETLSPIAQGYGAGQMAGEAYGALKAGDYLPAAGNAAMAAMAMVPMAKGKVPVAAAEPRLFYRGTNPGDARRIATGTSDWDSHLFASTNPDNAAAYGTHIERLTASPDAKILDWNTREYRALAKGVKGNLLETSAEIARRAKAAGYDAVAFERQGDVGTAIFNPDKFQRGDKLHEREAWGKAGSMDAAEKPGTGAASALGDDTGGDQYRRDYRNGGRVHTALKIAERLVNRKPSDAQKEAGNYRKGHVTVHGLDITIENPKGGERSGVGKDGKRWSVKMPATYGYVKNSEGFDGDHVDVYLGPDHDSQKVFVIDQINAEDGKFDEHKCMLSYPSKEAALADYRKAFSDGKADDRIGAVTEMTIDKFKSWVKSEGTQVPLGDLPDRFADGGVVGSIDDELADYKQQMNDPLVAYRTKFAEPSGPQNPVTWESRQGLMPRAFTNPSERPADWAVTSGLAETLSPIAQGYGAGQMTGEAYQAMKAGDYGTMAGAGALAAMGMMPMAGKGKSPVAPRAIDPLGYYSGALEAAKGLQQAKGTPEQMLAMMGKSGAKAAEIEATGLGKFLEGRPSVTRDEIVGHLEQNRLGLNEVNRGSPSGWRDERSMELYGVPYDALTETRQRFEVMRQLEDLSSQAKWQKHSLDPSNPTYRETVLHLPSKADNYQDQYKSLHAEKVALDDKSNAQGGRLSGGDADRITQIERELSDMREAMKRDAAQNFKSGHFDEPNIVGHMMTSMTKHEGRPVYTIDQIQSDWGQKLRDGGVRDEAKIAELKQRVDDDEVLIESDAAKEWRERVVAFGREKGLNVGADHYGMGMQLSRLANRADEVGSQAGKLLDSDPIAGVVERLNMLRAELRSAEASGPGHPLVNTTDQWSNTTLRRAIRQAAEADADHIAIPTGDTVLSYNPGGTAGMHGFYGRGPRQEVNIGPDLETLPGNPSRAAMEGIVPKNLRKMLLNLDRDHPGGTYVDALETPSGMKGKGFTLFPLTPKIREAVTKGGLPLFSAAPVAAMVPFAGASDAEYER